MSGGRRIGDVTDLAWSWRLQRRIGLALVDAAARPGDAVDVRFAGEAVPARLRDLPFV